MFRIGSLIIVITISIMVLITSCNVKDNTEKQEETVKKQNIAGEKQKDSGEESRESSEKQTTAPDKINNKSSVRIINPEKFQPLKVGNKWEYSWKSPLSKDGKLLETTDPYSMYQAIYEFGGRSVTALGYRREIRNHKEIYEITGEEKSNLGNEYIFTISSNPKVDLEQLRDGRYSDLVRMSRIFRTNEPHAMLAEYIARDWSVHKNYLTAESNTITESDRPGDYRDLLYFTKDNDGFKKMRLIWYGGENGLSEGVYPVTLYNLNPVTIDLPSGKYQCIETTVKYFKVDSQIPTMALGQYFEDKKAPLIWETHTFWAADTGMVREYQELADGKIAYEMELTDYSPSNNE